jgi:hypothetical protein
MFGFGKEHFLWKETTQDIEQYNEIVYAMLKMLGDKRIPEDIRVEYGTLIQEAYGKLFIRQGE